MTKKEALKIASEYGLEEEVKMFHDKFIEQGLSDEDAWIEALFEWDL